MSQTWKSGQLMPKGPASTTFANFLLDEAHVAVAIGEGFLSIGVMEPWKKESQVKERKSKG
ncbi:hypothetical protein AV545_09885 [Paenibacillus jamilae]|uniref:hypothetical protein n=1 Tax=Paenibacillus jamilae TaxID=114136 RepID=UPI0007AB3C8F|nr:hypothetical protein [Paenibacillus jamilae]KZE77756.1 hypothetical protein AV545_09885 [Paenibacillus jamilae]